MDRLGQALPLAREHRLQRLDERLVRAGLRLELLDPHRVIQRGFAWLSDDQGHAVTRAEQTRVGQSLKATLQDGKVDLTVRRRSA